MAHNYKAMVKLKQHRKKKAKFYGDQAQRFARGERSDSARYVREERPVDDWQHAVEPETEGSD